MHVKVLEFTEYPENGDWYSEKVAVQAWEDIEPFIRRLDRNRYPFLWLWPTADEAYHDLSEEDEVFQVMGGRGAYLISVNLEGFVHRRLDLPNQGEEEVWVWESDQGGADRARHICFDLEAVLHTARYYAEHGGFDPHLTWEAG